LSPRSNQLALAVDSLPGKQIDGVWFRHQASNWRYSSPGAGARSHGGRWNPAQSFPTLYLAEDDGVAFAELQRLADKNGISPSDMLPRDLLSYDVELEDVIDLRELEAQETVGLKDIEGELTPLKLCQDIGAVANHLGREGVLAPSAAGSGLTLAVFIERLGPTSRCSLSDTQTWDPLSDA